ncbi:helix-turn-helix transcriptional regulator [Sphingomonas jatrophae]|uniref:DNA-binding transcriptional regulator, CsgD family n=1 Tax=Sphingomonas jatrophae TaxID=1166337 RepID=A0A1I6KJE8_9SPHN|nr:helix-turn-helix transcriptional regulator [Sphingomonas jatrophae]SFR91168.1 DNA-binding transcriptional regulator, CsgD family [Sphingomonas jatrophae]
MPAPPPEPAYPDLPDVLAALFSSLLDAEPWAAFLDRLRTAANATYATLILGPRTGARPGLILTPGADPTVGAEYAQHLFASDPFIGLPDGEVAHFRDFVSEEALRRAPDFRAFMSSLEVLGVDLHLAERVELRLRLTRTEREPPFERDDAIRLQRLVPHVRIALALFDRLAAVESEQLIYAGAVAQMAIGVVTLDRHGKALRVNPRAAAILAECDGIALRHGSIALDDGDLARQLGARLANGAAGDALTLRVPRRSGAGDLLLVVGKAPANDPVGGGPAAVLFLTDPAHAPRITAAAVRERLGLTQSEAAVTAELAEGLAPAEVAARLGISLNTVRAHLRSIFAKTGVRRQSQLVQLVHHSLPGLGHPPG